MNHQEIKFVQICETEVEGKSSWFEAQSASWRVQREMLIVLSELAVEEDHRVPSGNTRCI